MSSSTTTSGTIKKYHAWKWTKPIPGELKYFLCVFCDQKNTGGIFRFKQHLVGTHKGIKACPKVPPNVKDWCILALKRNEEEKQARIAVRREIGGLEPLEEEDAQVQEVENYGYMAPEYAADGVFSVKSDVFSFGVLVLEIISGRRNKGFYHPDTSHNLIGNAWRSWNEGRPLELIDSWLESSCNLSEVLRCIQVGLLCLQHHPEDRPSMASVVIMLGSDIALAQPKQPGFFLEKEHEAGPDIGNESSTNEISISLLQAR